MQPDALDAVAKAVLFQENERRFLALEIHDVISQALAALFYRAQMCEHLAPGAPDPVRTELAEIRHLAQGLLDEVTVLIFNLRPPTLDEGPLTAVRRYVVEFRRQAAIEVDTALTGDETPLSDIASLFLYRLVQESLTNVRLHSRARKVSVQVDVRPDCATGEIRDDGVGFCPADLAATVDRPHLGIVGMRERAWLLGGSLEVNSAPGLGTAIRFALPTGTRAPK